MPNFLFNEGSLELPAHWEDMTVQRFHLPGTDSAGPASLSITREICAPDKAFADFIEEKLQQYSNFPNFQLLMRRDINEPLTYCWLDYTWQPDEERTIFVRQVIYESRPYHLNFTLDTTPEDKPVHSPSWREMIRSVQLRASVINGELQISPES